jgi:Domain of unknown function (DUF4082)
MRKTMAVLLSALTALALAATPASAAATPEGLWETSATPPCIADGTGPCNVGDFASLELGVKFQTSEPIYVVGLRFYRADAGTWSGSLWNADSTWITSADDSTSGAGWQTVMFSSPQAMGTGDTFVASYFAPGGAYAFEWDYFTGGGRTVGSVTALGGAGANGLFGYNASSIFPTGTFRDTNYWVTPLWVEDDTAPEITISSPADGASYVLNQQVAADYGCVDDFDPSPSCIGPVADGAFVDTASVGSKSFTVDSEDASGNADSMTHNYSVGYAFSGFLAPVDNPTTVNMGKAGRTYPVKFQLMDANGAYISALSAVQSITKKSTTCGAFSDDPMDALEATATGDTTLRYDATANQFIYNWKTPTQKGCYTLFVTLDSGQVFPAYFNLK